MAFTGFNYNFPADFTYASMENKIKYLDVWKEAMKSMLIDYLSSTNALPDLDKYGLDLYIRANNCYNDDRGTYSAWLNNTLPVTGKFYYKVTDLKTDTEVSGEFAIPKNLLNINILINANITMFNFLSMLNIDTASDSLTCCIHYSKYDITLVYPTNYDSLSQTEKDKLKVKMYDSFVAQLKEHIKMRCGEYSNLHEYAINYHNVTEASGWENFILNKYISANSFVVSNLLNYYSNLSSYNYAKYRCSLIVDKKNINGNKLYASADINGVVYTVSDNVFFIYFKSINIINRHPANVVCELLNTSIQTNILNNANISTAYGSTDSKSPNIYKFNTSAIISELKFEYKKPSNYNTLDANGKKNVAIDFINRFKDFVINKFFKTYNLYQNQKLYFALEFRKVIVTSSNFSGTPDGSATFSIQPNTNYTSLSTTFETTPYHIYENNYVLYGLCDSRLMIMSVYTGVFDYVDLPRTRKLGTIFVKNNILYLIGGLGEDNEPLFCIDQYDIEKGVWLGPWDYTSAIKVEDRPSYKIQSKWVNIPGTSKYVQVHKETENDYTCVSYMEIAKSTVMYYTTDGSDPKDKNNLNRVKYTGPFNIKPSGTKTTTVKVRAYTDVE